MNVRFYTPDATGARHLPIHVAGIILTQETRFDKAVLMDMGKRFKECRSLSEIEAVASTELQRWVLSGTIRAFRVLVLPNPDSPSPRSVNVALVFDEGNPVTGHLGGYVQGAKVNMDAKVELKNPLGRGESLGLKVDAGRATGLSLEGVANVPLRYYLGVAGRAVASVFKQYQDMEDVHGVHIMNTGVKAQYSTDDGAHSVGVSAALRDVLQVKNDADDSLLPAGVARLARPSLPSSLTYTFTKSSLDHPWLPKRGGRLVSEIGASLPWSSESIAWARMDLLRAASVRLGGFTSIFRLQGSLAGTVPFGNTRKRGTHIADRLTLGGVPSFRGFLPGGVGPQSSAPDGTTRALGGDLCVSATASYLAELPSFANSVRPHLQFFAQAGTLLPWRRATSTAIQNTARLSVGGGILFPTPFGNLEFNLTRVVRAVQRDRVSPARLGFQWGFST